MIFHLLLFTKITKLQLSYVKINGVNSSARTRHIDIRYFFIKDNGDIKVEYLHTKSMIADYLTKPLVGELCYKLRDLLLGYATL